MFFLVWRNSEGSYGSSTFSATGLSFSPIWFWRHILVPLLCTLAILLEVLSQSSSPPRGNHYWLLWLLVSFACCRFHIRDQSVCSISCLTSFNSQNSLVFIHGLPSTHSLFFSNCWNIPPCSDATLNLFIPLLMDIWWFLGLGYDEWRWYKHSCI